MIASAALAAWLADPEAQGRSFRSVRESALAWARHPLVVDTKSALAALEAKTPETVGAVARAFMDRGAEIEALMDQLLKASAADPFFHPPFHPMSSDIHDAFLLYHDADLSIALGATPVDMLAAKKSGPRGATSIGFTGVTTIYRFLRAGGATLSFWEAPPITDLFDAGRAGQVRFVDRRTIQDGEEMVIDGRHQSFVIDHAASEMILLQALVRVGAAPVSIEYDSKTMSFIGASSTDEESSRVQMMVSLLRTMEREDAVPLIVEALDSPYFYTRWHVMRELLALDADAALPHLRRMAASDPHPDVRRTASQTLELFFADEPEAAGDAECLA